MGALILGGVLLCFRGVIRWEISVSFLAGAAGTAAPGLGGALLPLVGGGLRLTQLLGRTAWEGVLQGHGEGVGFLLGLVLLGGTAELGQLL